MNFPDQALVEARMKSIVHSSIAATMLAVAIGLISGAHAAPVVVGGVEKIQEQASATQEGVTRALEVQGPVYFRDRMRTGPGARLEAKLDDGTVLTLGENGRLAVDEFAYRPGKAGGKLAVNVTRGAFLFVGGKIEGPTGGNVSIKTPIGTLGVRGTTVWGGPIDGGYGILVLKGEVVVYTRHGAIRLNQGDGTMVFGKAKPRAAARWPEARTKRAVASISWPIRHDSFGILKAILGDPGTVDGLSADAVGSVVDQESKPILGIRTVGNDPASLTSGSYPAAAITSGTPVTLDHIAGQSLAGSIQSLLRSLP